MNSMTRRKVLAVIPAALVGTSLPAMAVEQDPHIAWWRERNETYDAWKVAQDRADSFSKDDIAFAVAEEKADRLCDRWQGLESRITLTPAATLSGISVQVTLLAEWAIENTIRTEKEDAVALHAIAETLSKMAGGVA
jgi:hypothetical protein